ncbi:YtxH domain-containing protein [Oceanobacillus senegalensis]|uniref:YtxH domain-containing protein n=1 Tax=Oceanobacillus senegalensis TaxID=1936063 RepID=UPI000A30A3F1|nr:YtxH domain-containing protein [Oceanobacillus senegalensis]
MSRAKSLVFGLIVGGAVSASVALLTTPSSGRELRNRVKDQSVDLRELFYHLKEDGLRLKNQLTETSKESAVLIKDLTQDIKQSVEDWKQTVEPHQENIHTYLEQIESSLKDLEEKVKKQNQETT